MDNAQVDAPEGATPVPGDRPLRRGHTLSGRIGVVLVLITAGMLFAASASTARGTQLRSDRGDQVELIAAEQQRKELRDAQVARLQAQVDADTQRVAGGNGVVKQLTAQAQAIAPAAGLSAVTGRGLTVTLDDAPRSGRLPDGVKPDDLVVHQQDVQAVVNALWAGGATAMRLQDQRVISTSAVRCVGNTLILQGRVYSPPYVVTATGDPVALRAALNRSNEVRIYRQYVDALGLEYRVQRESRVELPAYSGSLDLAYARAVIDEPVAGTDPTAPDSSTTPTPRTSSGTPTARQTP